MLLTDQAPAGADPDAAMVDGPVPAGADPDAAMVELALEMNAT